MTPAGFHRPDIERQQPPIITRAYADALRAWVHRRKEIIEQRKKDQP